MNDVWLPVRMSSTICLINSFNPDGVPPRVPIKGPRATLPLSLDRLLLRVEDYQNPVVGGIGQHLFPPSPLAFPPCMKGRTDSPLIPRLIGWVFFSLVHQPLFDSDAFLQET